MKAVFCFALGAMLGQRKDKLLHVICYAGKALNSAQESPDQFPSHFVIYSISCFILLLTYKLGH